MRFPARVHNSSAGVTARHTESLRHEWFRELCNTVVLVAEQQIERGGQSFTESAYGWQDLNTFRDCRALENQAARVSKWRQRFGQRRLDGLQDADRTGRPAHYDKATEKRVLTMLDEAPPEGYAKWSGALALERAQGWLRLPNGRALNGRVKAYNQKAAPFEWTKAVVHPTAPKQKIR
jgi:hypothetical protein